MPPNNFVGVGCEFCAIANGSDRNVEVICETDDWVAFFPLHPATPGHTLLIPRQHVRNLWEVESSLGSKLMEGVIRLGRAIDSALTPEGMNLIASAGEVAEQTVFHLHLHVVPRWETDNIGEIWPVQDGTDDTGLARIAARIREECRGT